jgi:hypothetical protein
MDALLFTIILLSIRLDLLGFGQILRILDVLACLPLDMTSPGSLTRPSFDSIVGDLLSLTKFA